MTQACTMPVMDDMTERQRLVGRLVREGIQNQGSTYTRASLEWPMSRATLNRLMNATGEPVGARFLRTAERNLGLPQKLFDMILDDDVEAIRELPLSDTFTELQRTSILREMGVVPPRPSPARRKRA